MQTALDWYSLSVILLFIKMFSISLYQGFHRLSQGVFINPEDAKYFGKLPQKEEIPQVIRGAKAWRNDLENIPIFFALGIIYVLIGASSEAASWLFPVFTIARFFHTLSYLFSLQPWRVISYAVSISCLMGISWNICLVLFKIA